MELTKTFGMILVVSSVCAVVWTQDTDTFYSCPPINPNNSGICVESCFSDSDCPGDNLCCYNGCGHVCTPPINIPYHAPSLVCPEVPEGTAGMCVEYCDNCTDEELCCSNGCGHVCTKSVVSETPCIQIRDDVMGSGLMGSYVPQCEEDGRFSAVQCHGSTGYCWCVAEDTGVPVSDMVRFGMPECNCTYNDQVFQAGDVFPSMDPESCDICSCTVEGGVRCVQQDCADVGVSIFHSCPAVRAGASDSCTAECLLHSECPAHLKCCYNGCGYSCVQPTQIPYIDLEPVYTDECPAVSDVPCLDEEEEEESEGSESEWDSGTMESEGESSEEGSCREEGYVCDRNELCCDNDCGSAVCVERELESPCLVAVAISLNMSAAQRVYGRYKPLCTTEGLFREIQCHAHFCWCVEEETGVPLSDTVPFEQANVLACAACVYNGKKYRHLESFPSGDGCNTCKCVGGTISCSGVDCEGEPYQLEGDEVWEWWHSVLIGCVVVVVILISIVLVLLVGIVYLVRQNNPHRHHRLKEPSAELNCLTNDCELVEYRNGQDPESVELKVPVEDNLPETDTDMGPAHA